MQTELTPEHQQRAVEVLRLRYWQHLMNEDLKQRRFSVPIHLAIGHEAIAVAVSTVMGPEDQLVLTHRNIAYNLARAGALAPLYEEYQLAPSGLASGRLGSMNLVNPERGVIYSSSLLGNNIPVACGLALGKQIRGVAGQVILLTGDGGMEEGPFYEGLVFAKSHQLPLLILVENNDYAMSSRIHERRCPISLATLCQSVNIPFRSLSGNDVFGYVEALRTIKAVGDHEATPICVEAHLTTLNQHAGPTPGWPTDPKRISLEDGLIVEHTERDPVFVVQQQLGPERFTELADQVMAESWSRADRRR